MSKIAKLCVIILLVFFLVGGVVCGVIFGIQPRTQTPTNALTLNPSTTYYTNGTSFYTLTNTITYYRCTNSQHTGNNEYTSTSQESGVCYGMCNTCGGNGLLAHDIGWDLRCKYCGEFIKPSEEKTEDCPSHICDTCNGMPEDAHPHNFTIDHYAYTYHNIDTGTGVTTESVYSRATGYTITFDSNGGSGTMSSQYFLHNHSQAIKTNTFTRDNYTFLGWSTDKNATSATFSNGQSVSNITSGSSATLYAIWRNNLCIATVTCNNDSYGTVVGGGTYDINTLVALTALANDGYVFAQWEDSAGRVVSTNSVFTFTITENVTYKAVFQEISITITTTTGGGEIVDQTTAHTDVAFVYTLKFESGKYLNYMLINEKQININYTTGVITDIPECLGIEYMTNENASRLYLEVRNVIGDITITLNLVTVPPTLVPASSGININGVAVQATYGGSATVLGDNIDEMADSDTIILSAKIACVGYKFAGWYDVATNQLLSEEMSVKLPLSTVKNKLIIAHFEPISQNDKNDETDNNFDEFV